MLNVAEFKTIIDVVNRFPDEKSCHLYLAGQRWDGYMECPHEGCNGDTAYVFKCGIKYKCKTCNRQYTAKTGTIFEGTHIGLQKWFVAIFLFMNKKGISSLRLATNIGITQKSAWFMLQRIRKALGQDDDKELLDGTVEVDEAFYSGKNKNRHYSKRIKYKEETGRAFPDKTPIFGMYHRESRTVRAYAISNDELKSINRHITYNVNFSASLMTDDWIGYRGIDKIYSRQSIGHGRGKYVDGDVTTNRIENFWSHFKRGMHGTYIRVTPKHLNKYVQEFTFRFNYRDLSIQKQIEQVLANVSGRLKYKELIAS